MDCNNLAYLTDDQLIDRIHLYCKQVQTTMEQLLKENEIYTKNTLKSAYRMNRNKYITDVFLKACEMCNSFLIHNTVVWKMRLCKFQPSEEEMISQICEYCKEMRIKLPSKKQKKIKSLYLKAKQLYDLERKLFV